MEVGWFLLFPLKMSLEVQRVSLEEGEPLNNQMRAGRKERSSAPSESPVSMIDGRRYHAHTGEDREGWEPL